MKGPSREPPDLDTSGLRPAHAHSAQRAVNGEPPTVVAQDARLTGGQMPHHPASDRLARALVRSLARAGAWAGTLYRSASPRYANRDDLLTGAGSKTAGARWNPPNSFR